MRTPIRAANPRRSNFPRRSDEPSRSVGVRLAYNAVAINPDSLVRIGLHPKTFAREHGWLFAFGIPHGSSMGSDLDLQVQELERLGLVADGDFVFVDGAMVSMSWQDVRSPDGTYPITDWLVLFRDVPGGVRGRLRRNVPAKPIE